MENAKDSKADLIIKDDNWDGLAELEESDPGLFKHTMKKIMRVSKRPEKAKELVTAAMATVD